MAKISDIGKNNLVSVAQDTENISVKIEGNQNSIQIDCIASIGRLDLQVVGDCNNITLRKLRRIGNLRVVVKDGSSVSIGEKSSFEQCYILASEADVSFGEDCMVSFQVDVRTSDAHGIYDLQTGSLLNPPGNIVVGDHVWLAQGVILSKGAEVKSNSIVGSRAYVQKQTIPPNCIAAGAPAQIVKRGVIWDRRITENMLAPDANLSDEFLRWCHV